MPWKNPHCPKCHSRITKQIQFLHVTQEGFGYSRNMEYGKALFKCGNCNHEWEGYGHRRIKRKNEE